MCKGTVADVANDGRWCRPPQAQRANSRDDTKVHSGHKPRHRGIGGKHHHLGATGAGIVTTGRTAAAGAFAVVAAEAVCAGARNCAPEAAAAAAAAAAAPDAGPDTVPDAYCDTPVGLSW